MLKHLSTTLHVPITTVACPKCRGGCDLCEGSGQVPEGVASVYVREDRRATARMPAHQLSYLRWPGREENRLLLAIVVALVVGMVLGFLARCT